MERRYTYDCVIIREGDTYNVSFPQIPEAYTEGKTREEALRNAADVLELSMCDYERVHGGPPPRYRRSAEVVSVSVAVTEEDLQEMRCMTFSQAADCLEVRPPRITALVKSGVLEVRACKGRRMVTIESVERYRMSDRKPGRPRKEPVREEASPREVRDAAR